MPRFRSPALNARGMSLVEILVAMAILMVLVSVLATFMMSSNRVHRKTLRRAEIQSSSRQAVSLMTTELRQAGADPSTPPVGIVGIAAGDSISVHVRSDLNGDGVIQTAEPSEDVTYTYNPGTRTLLRNPGTGAVAMLTDVTSLRLSYLNSANQPLPMPLASSDFALVHSIDLTLTCESRDSHPFTHATRVTLRNQ